MGELQAGAVLEDKDILLGDAEADRGVGVVAQVPELAVHGDEIAGLEEREHYLLLLLGGVSRDVDGHQGAVEDMGAALHEVVDRSRDTTLVAWDRMRGDHDRVLRPDLYGAVGPVGDPAQRSERLALRARRKYDDIRVGDPVDVPLVDHHLLGQVEVAELACDLDVADHGAARDPHEPVVFLGRLDNLTDPVDVRGEGGHDDTALGRLEDLVQRIPHDPLRWHVAGPLRVGRVAEVSEHAVLAELGEPAEVHGRALYRGQVDLVVAGEDDQPRAGADGYCDGAGNGVVYLYKLEAEAAEVLPVAGFDLAQVPLLDPELLQFAAHEPEGELGGVDGHIELAQEIWQRAHVVLVTVRKHDTLQLIRVFPHIGKVGEHKVDPRHLLIRERHTGVDQDDPTVLAHGRHVLADLTQPPKGNDLQALMV